MNQFDWADFMEDISTEVAGGRTDVALVRCLKYGQRPTWWLLRKSWAGTKICHRWLLVNCHDLKVAFVWAAGLVVVGSYYDDTATAPIAVQLAIVLPFLGFVALVATDRVRRVRHWLANR